MTVKASWQSSRHDPWRPTLPLSYGAAYCLDCDVITKVGYTPLASTTECTSCGRSMTAVKVTIEQFAEEIALPADPCGGHNGS